MVGKGEIMRVIHKESGMDEELFSLVLANGIIAHRDIENEYIVIFVDENTCVQVESNNEEITELLLSIPLYSVVRVLGHIGVRLTERKTVLNYIIAEEVKEMC